MKAKAKNIASISFRCSDELHEQAEKLSEITMIPVSIMCRLALTEYIRSHSVNIVVGNEAVKKPTIPAPPKKQTPMTREEYEEDRLQRAWVDSLGGEMPTKKEVEYGDDW
jgi:hypothetical protein